MTVGIVIGFIAWFLVRYLVAGLYTVDQNERAVKTIFGRADRLPKSTLEDPFAEYLREDERTRYDYPQVRVIPPGGPYFKWPWERVYKVSIATQTINMAVDPEDPSANRNGTELEAVTKDQLNIGLTGQIRYRVCDRNLYAYLFGVKGPIVHVMGYFVSILCASGSPTSRRRPPSCCLMPPRRTRPLSSAFRSTTYAKICAI